jgi:tRNA dimethylallyltransferase
MKRPCTLLVVAGPTGVGKSDYSLHLAKKIGAPVVSADSRQVYRELAIGTARLLPEEQQDVPHYLLGHRSLRDPYDAGIYEAEAIEVLDKLFEEHTHVLLVGGTGLYIKAVLEGLDGFPSVPPEVRLKLQEKLVREGPDPLLEELKRVDPAYFETVDRNNPARIIRALSVCRASGQSYSSFLGKREKVRRFSHRSAWLCLPRRDLREHIDRRVDEMMKKGLVEEAKSVLKYRDTRVLKTVGYAELFEYFDGDCTLPEAVEEIKTHTKQYAKRQITWFKKFIKGPRLDATDYDALDAYYLGETSAALPGQPSG